MIHKKMAEYQTSELPTFTMATHLTMLSPNPDKAPQRPATVCVIHRENRKPIQLNRKDTEINIHLCYF